MQVGRQLYTVTGQQYSDDELQEVVDSGGQDMIYQQALMAPGQQRDVRLLLTRCLQHSSSDNQALKPVHNISARALLCATPLPALLESCCKTVQSGSRLAGAAPPASEVPTVWLRGARVQIKGMLSQIEQRHTEMQALEQAMLDLYQVFLDMSVVVVEQAEQLDRIENWVRASCGCIWLSASREALLRVIITQPPLSSQTPAFGVAMVRMFAASSTRCIALPADACKAAHRCLAAT